MAYTRRNVTDGETIMNKDLYDNLQDGIEEAHEAILLLQESKVFNASIEEHKD